MRDMQKFSDPELVGRVKMYLAENIDKTYVDVGQMARSLRERYREYNRRQLGAFRKRVEDAYKAVVQSYGLDATTSTEEESEVEVDTSSAGPSAPDARTRPQRNANAGTHTKNDDPIMILSNDEDTTPMRKKKMENSHTNSNNHENDGAARKKPKLSSTKKKHDFMATKVVKVNFDNIGGKAEILPKVRDFLLHMDNPDVYKQLGIKPPRGALLHGPPGTGKTLLAKAIAGQTQLPLLSVSGTQLVGGLSGESEERIRELFEHAASISPCILFIDEIDSICANRANAQKDMERRMVTQLLSSFDELDEQESQVLVLAATSTPDILDPALRRSGRLELEIALGIPSQETRKEILDLLCKNFTLDNDIDMNMLAQLTPGFVGADLQALVTLATNKALQQALNASKAEKTEQETVQQTVTTSEVSESREVKEPEETVNSEPNTVDGDAEEKETTDPPSEQKTDQVALDNAKKETDQTPINSASNDNSLDKLTIKQQHFLDALKVTKPSAVKEGIVTVPDVTWDDIGSLSSVRKDLQLAVMAPVKYPDQMKRLGLHAPSGVLLCGPPGCGKTLLAKAVANEARVNFISVKGPELLNMYVGESERAVRTCFRRALNSAPCVIFFDEFDSLCPKRGQHDSSGSTRVVNQLLTEMDGIEGREGVFVLAASNRPDIIDPAVLRPGRLDKVIYVGMPGQDDRVEILRKLTKEGTRPILDADVDFKVIAEKTDGFTGADLAGLVRGAATAALTQHITNGTIDGDNITVNAENFKQALLKCKPSVSAKDLEKYEKLREKYASEQIVPVMGDAVETVETA